MAEFDPDAYLAKEEKRRERTSGFDPDAYLAKTAPQPSAQSILGGTESSASKVASRAALADTLLNAVTSTWDLAARVPATAYHYATGPKGETFGEAYERAAEEVARTAPIKPDLVGRTLGITNTPQYSGALQRRAAEAIAPVIQENVIQPVAQATGLPEGAVADIGAIASIPLAGPTGRAVTSVARPVINTVKAAPGAVRDVGRGAYGAATGAIAEPGVQPKPWQQASSRVPVGEQFLPAEYLEAWRSGQMSTPEAQAAMRPSTELPAGALRATQGNVPYAGQTARAFGEQIGEVYRNPINLLTDVGLDVLTGGPIPTMGRLGYKGVQAARQAYGANKLGQYGFSAMSPEETAALSGGMPHPAAGPISPADLAKQMAASNIAPPTTPIQAAAQQTIQAKMRQTPPPGVSQMMTGESLANKIPVMSKADWDAQVMMDTLAGKPSYGAYELNGKIIHHVENRIGPFPVDPKNPVKIFATDAVTGERVPIGKNWTEKDPPTSSALIKERMRKGK